ncbi:MAG: hypothetical protein ABI338_06335 [Gemmatimonadaceae bacterium]
MRYGSLVVSAAVLLGLAACKGTESGMNAELAKDLNAAKATDPLALAPHAGLQTVVSAEELSPQARAAMRTASTSTRFVARRHAAESAPVQIADAPTTLAPMPVTEASTEVVAATVPTIVVAQAPAVMNAPAGPNDVPEPVVHTRGDGGGGIGGFLGAIGSAILRGGVVDGDHCDPRGHRGIVINQRGPILRGTY